MLLNNQQATIDQRVTIDQKINNFIINDTKEPNNNNNNKNMMDSFRSRRDSSGHEEHRKHGFIVSMKQLNLQL